MQRLARQESPVDITTRPDSTISGRCLNRNAYPGWNAKHFHEHLVRDHRFQWGYTFVKAQLHRAGLVERGASAPKKRGAHRRNRAKDDGAVGTGSAFAPVIVEAARPCADASLAPACPSGSAVIEIVIGAATVRVPAGTDAATLRAVLCAVKAAI